MEWLHGLGTFLLHQNQWLHLVQTAMKKIGMKNHYNLIQYKIIQQAQLIFYDPSYFLYHQEGDAELSGENGIALRTPCSCISWNFKQLPWEKWPFSYISLCLYFEGNIAKLPVVACCLCLTWRIYWPRPHCLHWDPSGEKLDNKASRTNSCLIQTCTNTLI